MTKKEFKEAMLRGLGRCVTAVRQEPEKYREIVLWACKRNIAYDAQCEGTRAWFVYTLASAYADPETFMEAAAEALKHYSPKGGWDLSHLAELLLHFAAGGAPSPRQAVEEKYREILAAMLARKRRRHPIFHELSDLETLGFYLADSRNAFLRIAKDFSALYREKDYLCNGDFDWFFSDKGRKYRKALEHAAKKDEDIACFFQREQAYAEEIEAYWAQRRSAGEENTPNPLLSRRLHRPGDAEPLRRYAQAYREQTQPESRAEALEVFSCYPYPDDPSPIIEDAFSPCEALQNAALRALENIRHPAVRTYALQEVQKGLRTEESFSILMRNYKPEDGALLESLLREQIAAKQWHNVHGMGLSIIMAFEKGSGIPHPKHLLPLLYEYNPCSCCRESALIFMSKHRMLTKDLLEECLLDSYEEIRAMAARKLKKQKNSKSK